MKKIIALLICITLICSVTPIFAAEDYISIGAVDEEYELGDFLFISADTNIPLVNVVLTIPYQTVYNHACSSAELAEGFYVGLTADKRFVGECTLTMGTAEIQDSVTFMLVEPDEEMPTDESTTPTDNPGDNPDEPEVDTPTEAPTEKPTSGKPNTGNSGNHTVTLIAPEKNKTTLTVGESEKINIETTVSFLTIEVDDEDIIAASISGKTLIITALKPGKTAVYLKTSNNYANVNVTVNPKLHTEDETAILPTEAPTETPTEAPTEAPTDAPTEAPTEKENPFTDLPDNHWAKNSIITLYKKGVINGMSETLFAPDSQVTRAQFVTMLTKAFNFKNTTTESPFNDVKENDWFFTSVMAAFDNSVTQGSPDGNFNPQSLITRGDMATLSYRAGLKAGIPFAMTTPYLFDDHDLIKDYAVEAVYAMKSLGIINGMTEKTFEPNGFATRAQAAQIIAKLLEIM